MPGRKFKAADGYRYGFNGKENDNEVKGEGNQQDYGMRVYDGRLGKFLSKDPLSFKFPFYSPYHFAGDNPIRNLDLDGGEPRDYIDKWVSQTMVGHATNEQSKSLIGHYDPKDRLHLISVSSVYDNVTEQTWYVHEENNQYYYWKFNDGVTDNVLRYQRGYQNGSWATFNTQEQKEARFGGQIADGLGAGLLVSTAVIAGGFAVSGIIASVAPTAILYYSLYAAPTANIANNYVIPLLDESGQAGNASAVVEAAVSKVAFGFEKQARGLANKIGGSHLMDFKGDWKGEFLNTINNSKNELHFSLNDFEGSVMSNILNPRRSNSNWELNTLYQNKDAFERTIFHVGDKTYTGSEVFSAADF